MRVLQELKVKGSTLIGSMFFNTKEFALVPDCYISEVASFANISQSDSVLVQIVSLLNQNLVFENEYGFRVGERRFGSSCNTKQKDK